MSNLAILGGPPAAAAQKGWPVYGDEERSALQAVLARGQWGTLGDEAMRFSERFAAYCGCSHGIAVTNGTISLELILRGMGIGWGDEVIVPAYTFYATISAVAMTGAFPVLADSESDTANLDPDALESLVTSATRAVIVTHVGGRPADMDRIGAFCRQKGLYLIEDAAHAHGSEWKGKRVGGLGDASSFSFQSSKNLTCGEGGFIATNNQDLYREFWHYHHSGRCLEGSSEFGGQVLLGTNARMAEWEAAILNVQMSRLDSQIAQRERNVRALKEQAARFPFLAFLPEDSRITRNAYHLLVVKYHAAELKELPRERFVEALNAEGIPCSTGYNPIHKMPALRSEGFYRATGRRVNGDVLSLPNMERLCLRECVWIPGWYLLGSSGQMNSFIQALDKISSGCGELL